MIQEIIHLFYTLSKEHIYIKSFRYDQITRGLGVGSDRMPSIFLEDPIYINTEANDANITTFQLNFNVLMIPQSFESEDERTPNTQEIQAFTEKIGLQFIARIKRQYNAWQTNWENNRYQPFKPLSYSYVTLKNFGDDNTIGTRFTLSFQTKNTVDNCDQGAFFDETKTFPDNKILPTQDTQNPQSCKDEFIFKLPKINYGDQG